MHIQFINDVKKKKSSHFRQNSNLTFLWELIDLKKKIKQSILSSTVKRFFI